MIIPCLHLLSAGNEDLFVLQFTSANILNEAVFSLELGRLAGRLHVPLEPVGYYR